MPSSFIAVLRAHAPATAKELQVAGAQAVLSWPEMVAGRTDGEWDDVPAVLIDVAGDGVDTVALVAEVTAALTTLAAVDGALDSTGSGSAAVIATTRPVTDTLKLVAADGTLTGTAERDDHRFVATPIAAKLRVLRAVAADLPAAVTPAEVLAVLAGRGFTVVAT